MIRNTSIIRAIDVNTMPDIEISISSMFNNDFQNIGLFIRWFVDPGSLILTILEK